VNGTTQVKTSRVQGALKQGSMIPTGSDKMLQLKQTGDPSESSYTSTQKFKQLGGGVLQANKNPFCSGFSRLLTIFNHGTKYAV